MFDWANIKERIYVNVSKYLQAGSPSYNESQIREAIEVFKDFILIKSGYHVIDGLPRLLLPSLQDALLDRKGEPITLVSVSANLESFTRKLLILIKHENYGTVENMTLIPLLKRIGINTSLSAQLKKNDYPQLIPENLESFTTSPQYLYSICHSYLTRNNDVHNSSDLDDSEVLLAIKHILIVYIYITLYYIDDIKRILPQNPNVPNDSIFSNNEQKMLYNLINFSNTSTEIKSQIVNAYILNSLRGNLSVEIDKIIEDSIDYFENSFSSDFYTRKISFLVQKGKLEYADSERKSIKLSQSESDSIEKGVVNFEENRDLFFMYYNELINKYGIEAHKDNLLKEIEAFFINNFNIDIYEIYCEDINLNDGKSIYSSLLDYIRHIVGDETKIELLFRDILQLCEDNDFILRICASKVFSKLSNPDQFNNYLRQQNRVVYLDSQIILYMLCCNYLQKEDTYDNIFYKITKNLLEYAEKDKSIKLKFGNQYLSEIVYQLKLALLLIPFADHEDTQGPPLSSNIFYRFYYYLKDNNLLESGVDTLEEFMNSWFYLNEGDVYDSEYERIASNNVVNILKELEVEVVKLPYYEDCDSAEILLEETIIREGGSMKSAYVLKNDAIMICHLSNSQYHDIEPFFLTWDKTFTPFRKAFKEKFRRTDLISWHLFNPSKFLNHMDLINFKMNPSSITNEYLSVIDWLGVHNMTRTFYDNMNRFLDIKYISKAQRHKYVKITRQIFSESEFSYNIDTPIDELKNKISDSFAEILDAINNYFYRKSKVGIDNYRRMLLNEDYFMKTAELIQLQVKSKIGTEKIDEKDFFAQMESNVKDYNNEILKSISVKKDN